MSENYFYTSVLQNKSDILLRGYLDGRRIQRKIKYKPYLFVETNKETAWRSLDGRHVDRIVFDNTYEARDFIKRYEGVSGFEIFGMTNWVYPFINDEFNGEINANYKNIRIGYIDIETWAEGEFELPTSARKPITAITLRYKSKNLVFGWYGDYTPEDSDTKYFKCADEVSMIRKFIQVWQELDLDVVTGWNIDGYDIPYIINRIINILGISWANKLSPWGYLDRKRTIMRGQEIEILIPAGIAILDYMEMYKKYRYKPQESYTLDFISKEELKVGKLDYSEYGSLHQLMVQNYQKYISYNIIDCKRVNELDDKLKYFNLLFTVAYTAHINFNDAFATTRPWDAIIHSYLLERNIVIPQMKYKGGSGYSITGGYVKSPIIGMHKWVVSFDVTSLYPHLIMQYNISPETIISVLNGYDAESILNGKLLDEELQSKLKENDACITATGALYDNSFEGFYPSLMRQFFELRAEYNGLKKKYAKELEKLKSTKSAQSQIDEAETLLQEYDARQNALKILLNGAYGALANEYYRWFDTRLAESITMSGQLSIQWVQNAINKKIAEITGIDRDYVIAIDTDSVVGDSIIRTNLGTERIDNFFERARADGKILQDIDDQIVVKPNFKCEALGMSDNGIPIMKPVNYVMAHKVKKKMYRIKVNGKEVIITEDHSLIVKRDGLLCSIKPTEIVKGDMLISLNGNRDEGVVSVENFCVREHDNFEIECIGEVEEWVYDIEVEGVHNFFANDILVHNSNYIAADSIVDALFPGLSDIETCRALDKFCEEVMQQVINDSFEELRRLTNCTQQKLTMKRECIANKGIWTAKKRYILNVLNKEGVEFETPELKMQGIEAVKSSTPRAAKDAIKEALKIIMNGTEQELQVYISAQRSRFRELPFEEIGFPRSVKHLEKYSSRSTLYTKGCPIHVRGALVYNNLIKSIENNDGDTLQPIVNGDKIKFAYMVMPNPVLENVIATNGEFPAILGLTQYIDHDMQFEKGLLAPVKVITDAIGWHAEPVASLEDLFVY